MKNKQTSKLILHFLEKLTNIDHTPADNMQNYKYSRSNYRRKFR